MPPYINRELSELWYTALRSPLGICIKTDNRASLRTNLYNCRKASQDPMLETLVVRFSPSVPDELWIVKREKKEDTP